MQKHKTIHGDGTVWPETQTREKTPEHDVSSPHSDCNHPTSWAFTYYMGNTELHSPNSIKIFQKWWEE